MLFEASAHCDEQAAIARRKVQKRAARAKLKVALGELFSARQGEGGPRHQRDVAAVDGRVKTSSTVEGRSASRDHEPHTSSSRSRWILTSF